MAKPSWVTCSPSSGTGSKSVNVTATANTGAGSRNGNITVKTTSGLSKTVSLSQVAPSIPASYYLFFRGALDVKNSTPEGLDNVKIMAHLTASGVNNPSDHLYDITSTYNLTTSGSGQTAEMVIEVDDIEIPNTGGKAYNILDYLLISVNNLTNVRVYVSNEITVESDHDSSYIGEDQDYEVRLELSRPLTVDMTTSGDTVYINSAGPIEIKEVY